MKTLAKFIAAVIGIYCIVFIITYISIVIKDTITKEYPVYLGGEK